MAKNAEMMLLKINDCALCNFIPEVKSDPNLFHSLILKSKAFRIGYPYPFPT